MAPLISVGEGGFLLDCSRPQPTSLELRSAAPPPPHCLTRPQTAHDLSPPRWSSVVPAPSSTPPRCFRFREPQCFGPITLQAGSDPRHRPR
ncbi:unnamed protein product [Arctogadus glacialis]